LHLTYSSYGGSIIEERRAADYICLASTWTGNGGLVTELQQNKILRHFGNPCCKLATTWISAASHRHWPRPTGSSMAHPFQVIARAYLFDNQYRIEGAGL
jgi:hypothetical protein